jgi:glutamine cyclotransferase
MSVGWCNNNNNNNNNIQYIKKKKKFYIQSDHKKTPQLISLLFEIRFQQEIHQIKGFKKYCIFRCYCNF